MWSEDEQWIERIFGAKKQSTIKKSHVEALMLQLVASGIFEYVLEGDKRMWKWGKVAGEVENATVKCYTLNEYWRGINFTSDVHKLRKSNKKKRKRR